MTSPTAQTITYSRVDNLEIQLDLYLPPTVSLGPKAAMVFFHGGGMITGCRKSLYFQQWFLNAVLENGLMFISADHRLILPSTGFDIITDVKNLFMFLAQPFFSRDYLPQGILLDLDRIAVVGESGGGYAARAAAIYAQPKPRAVMLQYAMGGQLLDDHWLTTKSDDQILPESRHATRAVVAHLLDEPQQPISYDPFIIFGEPPLYKGQTQGARMSLLPYWLNLGELLDYILGEKLSCQLRELRSEEERLAAIPEKLRPAILQSQLDSKFPPTFLMHGEADALILPEESQKTYSTLKRLGVKVELELLEGAEHTMQKPGAAPSVLVGPKFADGAEDIQKKAIRFLLDELCA